MSLIYDYLNQVERYGVLNIWAFMDASTIEPLLKDTLNKRQGQPLWFLKDQSLKADNLFITVKLAGSKVSII